MAGSDFPRFGLISKGSSVKAEAGVSWSSLSHYFAHIDTKNVDWLKDRAFTQENNLRFSKMQAHVVFGGWGWGLSLLVGPHYAWFIKQAFDLKCWPCTGTGNGAGVWLSTLGSGAAFLEGKGSTRIITLIDFQQERSWRELTLCTRNLAIYVIGIPEATLIAIYQLTSN